MELPKYNFPSSSDEWRERRLREQRRNARFVAAAWLAMILFAIAVWGLVGYAAYHFVIKFW